jgi:hypothetical protein
MTTRIITDSNGRKHITNEPLLHQPAPVQECFWRREGYKECPAAQPAPTVQEPAAYLFTNVQSGDIEASTNPYHKEGEREMWYREPLVRPPSQPAPWVGLTDEDVKEIREQCDSIVTLHAIKAIESKLKEKNT